MSSPRKITWILASLVGLDLVLTVWGFFLPPLWFTVFHGAEAVDPQGLLRRCAANWLGFLIVQSIALARWRRDPMWLAVVAGCRLGDALTDVTCLAFASGRTIFAWLAFPAAGIFNVVVGVYLIKAYRRSVSST